MHTPPARLLGMPGVSSPKYQSTEFVADLREEPVPTTSPTNATGRPLLLISSICFSGPVTPAWSGSMPSRAILNIAKACSGISGRDQASGAGDKSSVLVSPVTLNTTILIESGTSSRRVNHSPSAQLCITDWALLEPALASSATSWKASNTKRVCLSSAAAISPSSGSFRRPISVLML